MYIFITRKSISYNFYKKKFHKQGCFVNLLQKYFAVYCHHKANVKKPERRRKQTYEEKYQTAIPVFVAGGMFTAEDVKHVLALGADGIQAATRFVATEECDASDAYKQAYVNASEEDVIIIKSPVGMPGRAIKNAFIQRMLAAPDKISHCFNCLKACNPVTAPYCITQALINAVVGDLDNGLIFCGSRVGEIREITTVPKLMQELTV